MNVTDISNPRFSKSENPDPPPAFEKTVSHPPDERFSFESAHITSQPLPRGTPFQRGPEHCRLLLLPSGNPSTTSSASHFASKWAETRPGKPPRPDLRTTAESWLPRCSACATSAEAEPQKRQVLVVTSVAPRRGRVPPQENTLIKAALPTRSHERTDAPVSRVPSTTVEQFARNRRREREPKRARTNTLLRAASDHQF